MEECKSDRTRGENIEGITGIRYKDFTHSNFMKEKKAYHADSRCKPLSAKDFMRNKWI